eukprot:GHVS01037101.1.p3 GENE.GHVS01037101.1~~GHVS01037101.1.p3  ORF type:complete len:223 (+),score=43.71 GHVS01037101.1:1267-1935(+)
MGDAAKRMERDANRATFAAAGTATPPKAYVKLNHLLLVVLSLRKFVVRTRSVATRTATSLAVSEQAGVAPKHWGSVSPTENVVRGSVRMATAADERETDADKTRSAAAKTATKTKADVKPKNQVEQLEGGHLYNNCLHCVANHSNSALKESIVAEAGVPDKAPVVCALEISVLRGSSAARSNAMASAVGNKTPCATGPLSAVAATVRSTVVCEVVVVKREEG